MRQVIQAGGSLAYRNKGIWVATTILGLWVLSLSLGLALPLHLSSPLTYLHILLQTHLFTGLFITAHDAMHGTVAPGRPGVNRFFGRLTLLLYACNSWSRLLPAHHAHHRNPASDSDPDYGPPAFFHWFSRFILYYVRLYQIVVMAILFNLAALWIPKPNLVAFYIVPSLLSLVQLFYFGTYLPHRGEHPESNVHRARSQSKNHLLAFLSCYFFGYHQEHHEQPAVPWWRLPDIR
jgi:beta-carotene ketolase (CrtW type)